MVRAQSELSLRQLREKTESPLWLRKDAEGADQFCVDPLAVQEAIPRGTPFRERRKQRVEYEGGPTGLPASHHHCVERGDGRGQTVAVLHGEE